MKSPLRTRVAAGLGLVLAVVLALVLGRSYLARRAFERELAGLHPWHDPREVVAAALRVPRSTALLGPLGVALESHDYTTRLFAATIISYWDTPPRGDGLLPRPEHHEKPIEELLPLLPAIASAQRSPSDYGEVVDSCLVTVWDDTTLLECSEHEKKRPADDERGHRLHAELVGILTNTDPRPREKDGFSGLVYGYASDDALRAKVEGLPRRSRR